MRVPAAVEHFPSMPLEDLRMTVWNDAGPSFSFLRGSTWSAHKACSKKTSSPRGVSSTSGISLT